MVRYIKKGENKDTILQSNWTVDRVRYRSKYFNAFRGFKIEWLHNQNSCSTLYTKIVVIGGQFKHYFVTDLMGQWSKVYDAEFTFQWFLV